MDKSLSQSLSIIRHQKGAALILLFMAILMTGVVVFVSTISMNRSRLQSEAQTMQSLSKAKEALIAFASSYYERGNLGIYGILPCVEDTGAPGTNREGNESWNCEMISRYENDIGRLPWNTLGIGPVKDNAGECLWYAVSGEYANAGGSLSLMHNEDSPGMFELYDENGNLIKGGMPEDRVVAVIIAPGAALSGQNRPAITQDMPCNIDRITASQNISEYLDNYNGINNSDVNTTINTVDRFITSVSATNPGLNDKIITITANEIYSAIKGSRFVATSNFNTRMHQMTEALARCMANYARTNANFATGDRRLPWPALVDLFPDDYRNNIFYDDNNANGLLGRYPFRVDNSNAAIPKTTTTDVIFESCTNISLVINPLTPPVNTNLNDVANEHRVLWQHWKDHVFYVVSGDFRPDSGITNSPINDGACIDCVRVGANEFAAIVIYSGSPVNGVTRRSIPPEANNPVINNTKALINNYLESHSVFPDSNGNGDYTFPVPTDFSSDIAYCIDNDATLQVSQCPP